MIRFGNLGLRGKNMNGGVAQFRPWRGNAPEIKLEWFPDASMIGLRYRASCIMIDFSFFKKVSYLEAKIAIKKFVRMIMRTTTIKII